MKSTDIVTAVVWEDNDVTCLARVQLAGVNATQAVFASIKRNIYDIDSATPTTNLDGSTLTIASVVFDTLQTDGRWTEDETGYNFRTTVAGSIFTTANHRYRIECEAVGASGEKFKCGVFQALTKDTLSS